MYINSRSFSELLEHFGTANFPEYTKTVKTLDIIYFLITVCGPFFITVFFRRLSGSKS